MLRTIEKYFGAISSVLFSFLMIMILYIDPRGAREIIESIQSLPMEAQATILVLSIVTGWSGIKEFTG